MHACTRRICIFSKTNPQTPGASVLLGDNAPPSCPHTKIKTLGEVVARTPPVRRSQLGLLMVTCAPSAPSQSPVSQMRAGSPPHPPVFDSSCVAARLQERQRHCEGRWRKTAGGGMIPTPCPCSCLTPPPSTSMLASLSLQANAE